MLAGCYDEGLDTVEDPFDQLGFSCDFDGLTVETRWDPLEGIKHLSPMWLKDPDAAPNWAFDPPGHDPDERWRREELYLLLMQEAEITLELYLSELPAKDPITLEDAERAIARLDDFDFEGLQGIDDVVRRFARATTLSRARGRMSYHEWELNRQAKIRHRQAEKARLAALSEPERREVEETRAALELIGELEPEEEIVEEQATTTPKVVTSSAVDPILAAMGIA